jgi:hypothetical protein
MLAAAMRRNRFFFVTKCPQNHPETVPALPHRVFLSPYRNAQKATDVGSHGPMGIGGVTED